MLNDLKTGDKEYITRELIDDKGYIYGHMYVEEFLRCRNCRYRKMKKTTFRGEPLIYYRCSLLEREVEDDEFCSWGDEK